MFSNVQSRYSEEEERCSLKRQFFAFNKHPVLGRDSSNHQQCLQPSFHEPNRVDKVFEYR